MRRPSFGVVAGVVCILAVIAFLTRMGVDLVPAGPDNRLASETAEFLVQGSHEQIDWRTLSEDSFQDARRPVEKPIMLVVGSACSPVGRAADRLIFQAKEVCGFLKRNFICIRVDTMSRPEFQSAYWPLSRDWPASTNGNRLAVPPDFQVWFLDSRGRVFELGTEITQGQTTDPRAFLKRLEEADDRFDKLQDKPHDAGAEQRKDLEEIETQRPPQLPNLSEYAADL